MLRGGRALGVPGPYDWKTDLLPSLRRALLDSGRTFENITAHIVEHFEITKYWHEPLRDKPKRFPCFDQACFRIRVDVDAYDLFFNAPDGLRGRYWQGPESGDAATRHLINAVTPQLLAYAATNLPTLVGRKPREMMPDEVMASLKARSAKVWIREEGVSRDEFGLIVDRWQKNEDQAPQHCRSQWRWTPRHDEIEVKGALIRDNGEDHIPENKRCRALHIHRYGWT